MSRSKPPKRSVDEYGFRAFKRYPPGPKSSVVSQVLMRFKINQHPEHVEAHDYVKGLSRGEMYDTVVRALLLYRDYEQALNGLDNPKGLADWTIGELLEEAAKEDDEAN
jgi:hypothetical protein